MELIQSRNYVHFMKAEYFCLFLQEIATGHYSAPDEFNERLLTPSFFIAHFNVSPCHSGPSRCVTLYLIKTKYCRQTRHLFNAYHPVLRVSVQRIIIRHYFPNI